MHACVCACMLVQAACKQIGVAMHMCMHAKSLQSSLTLYDPVYDSLLVSSLYEILQARVQMWVAIPSSRGSPNPGIEPGSPVLQADSLPAEPPGKPHVGL